LFEFENIIKPWPSHWLGLVCFCRKGVWEAFLERRGRSAHPFRKRPLGGKPEQRDFKQGQCRFFGFFVAQEDLGGNARDQKSGGISGLDWGSAKG